MSRPTHTDAGLKIEAYRCTWDGGGESAGWVQYNDAEGGDDPMPDAWDDEPDEVVALVLAADAGAKIKALAKIGAENFSAAVEARDAADAAAQQAADLRAECERLRAALIACKEPVEFDRALQQMLVGPGDGDVNAYRKNRIARLSDLLDTIDAAGAAAAAIEQKPSPCGCLACIKARGDRIGNLPREMCEMVLCATCGNKRCPHATDHRHACTGSNNPGQPGSAYPATQDQPQQ